jgi:chromosome segregation ATPase
MSEQVITLTAEDQRNSNPRAAMVRAEVRSARGYANQRAHDLRDGPQPEYVQASRSHLNRIIIKPPTAPEMRRIVEERRAQRDTSRALKSNAGIAVVGIIGFGIDAAQLFGQLTPAQQDKALLAAGHAVAAQANTTMEGLVYHLDESTGHAHVSWCGYDLDGVPLSSTMKRGMLTKFQDVLAEVMAEHCPGIERGNSKWKRIEAGADYAETVHKTVAEMHGTMRQDYDALSRKNEELRLKNLTLENRVTEMQGRVDKLVNEEKQRELTAAKVKRLRVYRSRLTDRIGDLRSAREELTQLTAQIETKRKLVTDLEGRADQAEQRVTTATETLQEARQAADAAEGRKSDAEASAAALAAEKTTLDADVSALTETKAKLEPEVDAFEKRKSTLQSEVAQHQAEGTEAQKRAVQARQAAEAALAGEKAAMAALDALRAQIATLKGDRQGLTETKSQLQSETVKLGAEVAALTAQKDTILTDGRKLFKSKKVLQADVLALQKNTHALEVRNAALKAEAADILGGLEILQPALQAADALQQMSELDLDEKFDAWSMMANPAYDCSSIEHASAIRMIDPLFAPEIPLPRSRVLDENLETLHACPQDLYDAVVDAVMSEEGSEAGVSAIRTRSVYLNQDGTVEGLGSVSEAEAGEPGIFGKAFRWAKNAFEGVKRGVGLAVAAAKYGISEELTAARANLFYAFEPRVQSALRLLLKAEGRVQDRDQKHDLDQETDLSNFGDFEP